MYDIILYNVILLASLCVLLLASLCVLVLELFVKNIKAVEGSGSEGASQIRGGGCDIWGIFS